MTAPSVVGVILARMDSARLPGKVLMPVNNMPLIKYVIERAKRIPQLTHLALATTQRQVDDVLADYVEKQGVMVFRGATHDVSKRILDCTLELGADYFLRINGDSPFLDPEVAARGFTYIGEQADLITNLPGRTFPYGIAVELVRCEAFMKAYKFMSQSEEREHVTLYFYNHSADFKLRTINSEAPDLRHARLVVDTETDIKAFKRIVEALGPRVLTINYREVADLYLSAAQFSL